MPDTHGSALLEFLTAPGTLYHSLVSIPSISELINQPPLDHERFRKFIDRAADLALSFGGSLSAEHGDGHARAALLPRRSRRLCTGSGCCVIRRQRGGRSRSRGG
jgi:hypothetical protein